MIIDLWNFKGYLGALLNVPPGGGGDFSGPLSATDDALVRFAGTGGKTGQNSNVTLDDDGFMRWSDPEGAIVLNNLTGAEIISSLVPEPGVTVFDTDRQRMRLYRNATQSWTNIAEESPDTVVIAQKEDFPAPSAGVITLEAGKFYDIRGIINLGTDRFAWNGALAMFGRSAVADAVVYVGTAPMFTASGDNFVLHDLAVFCPLSAVIDFTSAGATEVCIFDGVQITGAESLGTIAEVLFFAIFDSSIAAVTAGGFTFTGASNTAFVFRTVAVSGVVGTAVGFGTSVFDSIGITGCSADTPLGSAFLDGAAASANVNDAGRLSDCTFTGLGDVVAPAGITRCDLKWVFSGNIDGTDISDTAPGIIQTDIVNVAETVISTQSVAVAVNATFVVLSGSACKFSGDAAGLITYDGPVQRATRVDFTGRALMASGGSVRELNFYLALNGTIIPDSIRSVRVTSADFDVAMFSWVLQVDMTDDLQIFVSNETDTSNPIVDQIKTIVS